MTDQSPEIELRDNEVKHDDGSLTIALFYPFQTPTGDTISEVILKRVKQKTMKDIRERHKKNPDEVMDAMIAHSSGLALEDIGELDMEDYTYIAERFSSLVGLGAAKSTA